MHVPITLLLFISISLCMCKRPWWSMFIHRLTFLNNSNSSLTGTFLACRISCLCFIIQSLHFIFHLRCRTWIILFFLLFSFSQSSVLCSLIPLGNFSQNTAAQLSTGRLQDRVISAKLECNYWFMSSLVHYRFVTMFLFPVLYSFH